MSKNPLLARGMANVAWEAYEIASKAARINIEARADRRVVQAVGYAEASAGYHAPDGVLDGKEYAAAADLSVRDLTKSQIATWIDELCQAGFVAFYRNWPGNLHIHANYAGLPQKRQLDGQNEDFFAGRDGLVSHSRIDSEWWYPELEARKIPEAMFRRSNPKSGAGVVVRCPAATGNTPPVDANALYLGDQTEPALVMPVFAGVSYAPVRAFGSKIGLDVLYDAPTNSVKFQANDVPIALKIIDGVGYAPIRQLAAELGLKVDASRITEKRVRVYR